MTASQDPLGLIDFKCERCERGFVKPRHGGRLGFGGNLRALRM